jgi:HEAT repeat protein
MRTPTVPLVVLAGALGFLGEPAGAQDAAPADEHTLPALAAGADACFRAANDLRAGQGLPGYVWSEFIAIILREHLDRALELGWDGAGPAPAGLGSLAERSRLHGLPGLAIPVQFTTQPAGAPDAAAALAATLGKPEAQPMLAAKEPLFGAAIRPRGDRWLILVGVLPDAAKTTQQALAILQPFIDKAANADPVVRHVGLRALGESKSTSALPVVRAALRAEDAPTRAVAAEALGGIRSRAPIPLLLHAAADPDAAVRTAAFRGLGALTGQASLGEDLTAWTRWWAAVKEKLEIKFDFAVPTAREPLALLLTQWNDAQKRGETAKQVEVLRALRSHPEATDREAQRLVLGAIDARDRAVSFEACRCAAWNKLPAAVPPLIAFVKKSYGKDHDMAKVGLLALAQIGDLKALPLITDSPWAAKDGEVLWVRIHVSRYFRSPKSAEWLISLITVADAEHIAHYAKVIAESLEFLSGETHGEDGRAWKDWWKRAKGTFRPEPLPDGYRVEWLFDDTPAKK